MRIRTTRGPPGMARDNPGEPSLGRLTPTGTRVKGLPGTGKASPGRGLGAAGGEAALIADEVVDAQDREIGAVVAVGVGVAGREPPEEAEEVADVQDRGRRAGIAVGVAAIVQVD